jgi:hypothetical protein
LLIFSNLDTDKSACVLSAEEELTGTSPDVNRVIRSSASANSFFVFEKYRAIFAALFLGQLTYRRFSDGGVTSGREIT